MATPQQIDEQVKLERLQISQGIEQLRKNTKQLETKSYASATVYGITSIDTLLPLVIKKIEDTNNRIKEGKTGRAFKEINQYLEPLEPLAAATIALKITFDKVFTTKKGSNQLAKLCEAIGRAIEDELQMRHYENKAPGLLQTLKNNYWHRSIGTKQKIVVIQTLMNRYNVDQWKTWTPTNRVKLGGWLLDCIMTVSNWFYKDLKREGRKTIHYILPTPEFLEIKDQVIKGSEMFAPLAWPMLIEPNDWTPENAGGYILNEVMKGHQMVRRGDPIPIQGENPYKFLNKIQKVGFKINLFTFNVAEWLECKGISVGKFIPVLDLPLPPKPFDIAENKDSRKAYRRAAAEVMNTNANAFRRSCRTRMTMDAARRFRWKSKWFIPWSFDYRGRAYPIPAFLTPQDTDFGKALIRFADEAPMTPEAEDWLAFQVATTYGLDKATMGERLQWTKENITLISRIAKDPYRNIGDWEGAEEPFQFLAACDEYYNCVVTNTRQTTGLYVACDATCSGLQILAGLARDKSTAQLVNVLPSDRPQDAYKVVAQHARAECPESIRKVMDRKVVKRTVMTIPYNAKPYSNRSYIRDALKEKDIEISKEELTQTVTAVRNAMKVVVPGALAVMNWIEKEVANALKRGDNKLTWTTPSGFIVNQTIMKKNVEKLELQLLGRCIVNVATDDTDEVDKNRHKAATAPNLIHSLDASLLHLAVDRFDKPIALIHDSVLCRATDMSLLSSLVRETYMKLFAKHDYLTDFAKQIGAETEPPIIGNLEPETVIDSTYFFC
jgi:DNA-directed RNA polymerase